MKCQKKAFIYIEVSLFRYCFEKGIPGEYIYRLEMLPHFPNHPKSIDYIRFFGETDAQMIGSIVKWVYFRKKTTDGYFEIFSDIDSKIHHLKRIKDLILPVMILEFSICISNMLIGLLEKSSINFFCAFFLFIVGVFLAAGLTEIFKEIKCLEKERGIHE